MNVHHLELFYFVAKHGGIAAAVRNIPYGIQQPAVSGQIAKLEESLGTKLFQRRPFALSPAGAELFEFIKPFFDNVDIVAEKLRQNSSPQLRIAAPSIVLHDYVPELLRRVRRKISEFRLCLHEAARAEAERLLLAQDVDLAITFIEKKSRGGIQARPLLELPLILLVHKKSRLARSEELWKRDKIEETLISFPQDGSGSRAFPARSRTPRRGMVLRNRSQLGAIDRTLCRERLRNWSGGGGARFQTVAQVRVIPLPEISAGRHRRGLVRETFQHREAIARRTGNRSSITNAPDEGHSLN